MHEYIPEQALCMLLYRLAKPSRLTDIYLGCLGAFRQLSKEAPLNALANDPPNGPTNAPADDPPARASAPRGHSPSPSPSLDLDIGEKDVWEIITSSRASSAYPLPKREKRNVMQSIKELIDEQRNTGGVHAVERLKMEKDCLYNYSNVTKLARLTVCTTHACA